MTALLLLPFALVTGAEAYVDPECAAVAALGPPADYNEIAQGDFLLNYFSLATTLSPLHAPVPHKPGHGSLGLELSFIPALSCEQRLVLAYTKTEDTNKAPLLPRPHAPSSQPGAARPAGSRQAFGHPS